VSAPAASWRANGASGGASTRSSTAAGTSRSSRSQWTYVRLTVSTVSPRWPATAVIGAPSASSVDAHRVAEMAGDCRNRGALGEQRRRAPVAAGVEPEPILCQPRGLERQPPRRSAKLVAGQHLRAPQPPQQDPVGLMVAHVTPELDRHESGHRDRPDFLGLRRGEHSPAAVDLHLPVDGHPALVELKPDQPRRQMSSLVASWLACRLPRPLPRCVRTSTRKRLGVTSRRSRSVPTPPRRTRKSPSTSPTRRSRRPNARSSRRSWSVSMPRTSPPTAVEHLNLDPPIYEAALAKNRPLRVIGLSGRRTERSRY